jgi:hypothetical protein
MRPHRSQLALDENRAVDRSRNCLVGHDEREVIGILAFEEVRSFGGQPGHHVLEDAARQSIPVDLRDVPRRAQVDLVRRHSSQRSAVGGDSVGLDVVRVPVEAVRVVRDQHLRPYLATRLGPEPLDPGFTVERLAAILAEGGHTLKWMLTDQRAMAGVGNAWSDDVLHRAKMSPFARPERLDPAEVERLHAALVGVLTEARATLASQVGDEVVIPKASERLFAVHGRAGAACYVCGDTIRSVWMGDRETSYCPTCQTGGRILADRRRSRFLR